MHHQPGGSAVADMDLRYETDFGSTQTCGVEPAHGDLGVEGALVIDPGAPESSVLSLRMHALDDTRMPSLATGVVDPTGTEVVDRWIRQLNRCPVPIGE